jgi:predicted DCC family thiol-disulfide oxidoreductase YuxK
MANADLPTLARRGERIAGPKADFAPYQQAASRFPEIPEADFLLAVQLIECDGRVYSGAEAAVRVLAMRPVLRGLRWLYDYLPGFGGFSEWIYRVVARNRTRGCSPNSCP